MRASTLQGMSMLPTDLPQSRAVSLRGRPLRVCVAGGDRQGWALDTEMRLARRNLSTICEVVDDEREADVLHSIWPENTAVRWDPEAESIPVVLSFSNEPFRLAERPRVLPLMGRAAALIAQSTEAYEELERMQFSRRHLVPYPYDRGAFVELPTGAREVVFLKERLSIPTDAYVVGNFFRDTSGADLSTPKRQKGADIFATMMEELGNRIAPRPLVVLLAGPRRHWLRGELHSRGVDFRFYGKLIDGDDNPENILDHSTLSLLYNVCDIQVIPSRWEGGPRAVMECALTGTALISTAVGVARDVVPSELCFDNPALGVDLLERDARTGFARELTGRLKDNLEQFSATAKVVTGLRRVYDSVAAILESGERAVGTRRRQVMYPEFAPRTWAGRVRRLAIRGSRRLISSVRQGSVDDGTIVFWSNFRPPPYGGANQFLLALEKALERRGYNVLRNDWRSPAGAHLFNSMSFDYTHIQQLRMLQPDAVFVQRVDGPISRYRGTDPAANDDIVFGINKLMNATVFQSAYSLCGCAELGYRPVLPSIVRNSVDPDIFHPGAGRERCSEVSIKEGPIKIVSTSWSDNPRKGRDIFAALDRLIDFARYDYRFIGRCEVDLSHITKFEPMPSERIADELRRADIFIFASAHESASNALTEALACGTPVIYLDSGGNREIVGAGGLAFRDATEVPLLLDRMAANLSLFRDSISVPSIDEIAANYIAVIENARWSRPARRKGRAA